jgi:lactoylglutathione lyase
VDDISAVQARFESLGVRIVKKYDALNLLGETEESRIVAGAWGFWNVQSKKGREDTERFAPSLVATGFKKFLVVADPDSNLFDVQAMEPTAF